MGATTPVSIEASAYGLTSRQAAAVLAADGPNELPSARPRTLLAIGFDVMREPMLLLLVATGIVYLLLGDGDEALAILTAIGVVIGISLYQTRKTERALHALRDLSSPLAQVIRDGTAVRIPGRDVVCGDRLILHEGDRIPADAHVDAATNLAIDESPLTGESVPVAKDRDSTVHSGCLIVGGTGTAVVSATGTRTELGRIGTTLAGIEIERTSLEKETARIVRFLAIGGVAVCTIVAAAYGVQRGRWLDGALAGLTVALSMVPEEFPVILTIFLALGAWRISHSRVLTRRIPAIETLGAATVLCVDKTGTLTLNRMSVVAMAAADDVIDVAVDAKALAPRYSSILEAAMLACRPDAFDPMERAFVDLGIQVGIAPPPDLQLVRQYPLSDELLAVTQVWETPANSRYTVATKGAPESIARLCALQDEEVDELLERAAAMARRGLRVLAVASGQHTSPMLPDSPFGFRFELLGVVGLQDPVRPGVPAAVDECRSAGIRVVMITGDHAETARHIAKEIGLSSPQLCLTGTDLNALDDNALQQRLVDVNIFARVVPAQKLRLVNAFRGRGEIVAMTGDGVNDAPALKAAHIGIAMGRRGTDVAREAAALVLLDDDFSSIVRTVRLGRRIYDNITKAVSYVLGIHVPIAGVSMMPLLFGGPMVLMPVHIILMELIIDPACSVAFEMEPADPGVMRRAPRRSGQRLFTTRFVFRSLTQGGGAMAVALLVYFGALRSGYTEVDVRALTFATLIVSNIALILASRSVTASVFDSWRTPNRALWSICGAAFAVLGAVLFIPVLRNAFRLAMPHPDDLLIVALGGCASLAWMELVKRATGVGR